MVDSADNGFGCGPFGSKTYGSLVRPSEDAYDEQSRALSDDTDTTTPRGSSRSSSRYPAAGAKVNLCRTLGVDKAALYKDVLVNGSLRGLADDAPTHLNPNLC